MILVILKIILSLGFAFLIAPIAVNQIRKLRADRREMIWKYVDPNYLDGKKAYEANDVTEEVNAMFK